MAWLMDNKLLNACAPVVRRSESTLAALRNLNAYGEAHPELFPIKMAFSRHGVPIPRELLPISASVECRENELPEILLVGDLAISPALKRVIEAVEPNVHQFHSIPITCLRRGSAIVEYFILVVGHAIYDQVDLSRTTQPLRPNAPDIRGVSKVVAPTEADGQKIAIFRDQSRRWHMWWSWDIHFNLTISNELKAAIEAADLRCLTFTELLEVN